MADCHRGVLFQQQNQKRFPHQVTAVYNDYVHPSNVYFVIIQKLHDARRSWTKTPWTSGSLFRSCTSSRSSFCLKVAASLWSLVTIPTSFASLCLLSI